MSSTVAVKAFAEGVTQQIKDYLPEEYQDMQCEISEQQKNNGVVLTGIDPQHARTADCPGCLYGTFL